MKRLSSIALFLAALSITACSNDEAMNQEVPTPIQGNTLTATFANDITRTYTENGANTKWTTGDQIVVKQAGNADYIYTLDAATAGTGTGTFVGKGNFVDDDLVVYAGIASNVTTVSATGATITVPAAISYAAGDVSCNGAIMMGKISENTVAFKNAGAILYIKVDADITLSSLKVTSDVDIAGTANVTWSNGAPTYSISSGTKEITVSDISGTGAKTIAVPLPVGTYGSLKLIANDGTNDHTVFTYAGEIARNKYYTIDYKKDDADNNVQTVMGDGALREAAVAAATSGGVIKLMDDVTIEDTYLNLCDGISGNTGKVEIDLNGHTLTSDARFVVDADRPGETIIKNGTLKSTSIAAKSRILCVGTKTTLENVTIELDRPVDDESVVIGAWGTSDVTINNCTIKAANMSGYALYQNGSYAPSTWTISGTTINCPNSDVAVYVSNAADKAKQNVEITGSTITAKTCIEVKHSNLTVKSTTLNARGDQTYRDYGNGNCTTGYCVAVTGNSNTDAATGIIVLGGSEAGEANTYSIASDDNTMTQVYIHANETSHTTLELTNDDNATINWGITE